MNEQQDYELKIDIIEWVREIKNHITLIIASALLFAGAAGAYAFLIKGPVYSYSIFIYSPGLADQGKLTYINLFKNDIGMAEIQKNGNKAALTKVELVKSSSESRDIKEKYTSLIRFTFEGNNPDAVTKYAKQYVNKSLQVINAYIEQQYEIDFSKEYLEAVRTELKIINNTIAGSSVYSSEPAPAKAAIDYLQLLKERLETKEISKAISKAEIIESQKNTPRIVRDIVIIRRTAFLGLFLGFAYVSYKYLAKAVSKK